MISCPGCGQGLRFDVESQQMHCDYCGAGFDPYSFDSEKGGAKQEQSFDTFVWTCPSCGGQLETVDETDAMGFCPYCGGASLLADRIRKRWRPKSVIPFSVTKEQCKAAYLAAAKKRLFVSGRYKDPQLLESFRGIYMPYWTYRLRHRGTYYIPADTPQRREGDYLVTGHYELEGEIDMESDGYAHDASSAFDDRISQNLEPFHPEARQPFAPGFLSGFYTIVGDKPREKLDAWVEEAAKQDVLRKLMEPDTALGLEMRAKKLTPQMGRAYAPSEILDAERCLYPVWFMSYRQGDQLTYAAVNGQTGKVFADFPTSLPKVLAFGVGLAVLFFLLLLFATSIQAGSAAMISAALYSGGLYFLENAFRDTTDQSRALLFSAPSQRYQDKTKWRVLSGAAGIVIGVLLRLFFHTKVWLCCGFCVVLAGLFCWFIYEYIQFQLAIARRRPRHFNRKGAASDER
jgi:DNA-directed RNA polymerase subunit RPC12/RpoP